MSTRLGVDIGGTGIKVAPVSWKQWTLHLRAFLKELERLVSPDLFIIGGGISAEFRSFCQSLRIAAPVVAATLGNDAGIVGAALAARDVPRTTGPVDEMVDH